mgnify:CR=1 FL=1
MSLLRVLQVSDLLTHVAVQQPDDLLPYSGVGQTLMPQQEFETGVEALFSGVRVFEGTPLFR